MQLIDRDAVRQELVKAMERNLAMFRGTGKADARVLMALQYAIAKLDSAPVVDAVPVSWILDQWLNNYYDMPESAKIVIRTMIKKWREENANPD